MPTIEAEVLATNLAFYDAFARGDLEAFEALWAQHAPVACVHPGWGALHGRDEVMASWRAILGAGGASRIRCTHASAHVVGDCAYVICGEALDGGELVATNMFCREDGTWKLVLHQAGPVNRRVERRARPSSGKPN